MSALAVKGCELELTNTTISGEPLIDATCLPSSDILVNDKGVYFDKLTITMLGATISEGAFICPSATFTINGSCEDVLEREKNAVLEGDESDDTQLTFTSSSGAQTVVSTKVRVKKAGQDDVEV